MGKTLRVSDSWISVYITAWTVLSLSCTYIEDEDHKMGDLGSDQTDQLDRNMWAPEEKNNAEV